MKRKQKPQPSPDCNGNLFLEAWILFGPEKTGMKSWTEGQTIEKTSCS